MYFKFPSSNLGLLFGAITWKDHETVGHWHPYFVKETKRNACVGADEPERAPKYVTICRIRQLFEWKPQSFIVILKETEQTVKSNKK